MALIHRHIGIALRLLVCLLLSCCLSPLPETPEQKVSTFATLVSSGSGPVRLVIWKSHYTLTLYKGETPVKTYRAVFGKGFPHGDKQKMGDKRTPEGEFYICTKNHSKRFYKFMGVSYPGLKHAEYGLRNKLITQREYGMIKKAVEERQQPPWHTRVGGAIGIHGRMIDPSVPASYYSTINWTDGCIALDNADVDEIYEVVTFGTPVTILP